VISRAAASPVLPHLLPALLAALWLCGFVAVLFVWHLRWRRILSAIREAVPLRQGREAEMLRRLGSIAGARKPIELLLSRTSLEPGIFGIARPVLIWPEGISERLEDAHLEAILAHELWHVRRRDNLAAAIHMLVEAIFWFYPPVWWLGGRLVAERERACDEEVLELGTQPQVYAESILKVCEFCVESPLACISGVTGADLKKRMVNIMTKSTARKLDFGKKLLLSATGFAALAVPLAFGLLHATPGRAQSPEQNTADIVPAYESVLIKPNKTGEAMPPFKITGRPVLGILFKPDQFMATSATLRVLMRLAYDLQDEQISGGPAWFNSENYDVDAKLDKSVINELQKLNPDQLFPEQRRIFQALLVDRFKLALHWETKELPVYELAIASGDSRLQQAKPGDTYPNGVKGLGDGPAGTGMWIPENGQLIGQGVPIGSLVRVLSEKLGGRVVLDKTGLTGRYDFTLRWAPDASQPRTGNQPGTRASQSSESAISMAIQAQLGLKLESQTAPIEVLVIDHASSPQKISNRVRHSISWRPFYGAVFVG
jgi:bla regulator protein BlaR1